MIILKIQLDGIYGFNDFELDLTYPKKIVNSIIDKEHLKGRERFRYKKIAILMGPNATGKTSLARALQCILDFIQSGCKTDIFKIASKDEVKVTLDFVNNDYTLRRLELAISRIGSFIHFAEYTANIEKQDSYEMCEKKLKINDGLKEDRDYYSTKSPFADLANQLQYRFTYPDMEETVRTKAVNEKNLLKTLRAVIGTLDPTLTDVRISKDLKNSFIIRRGNQEIIIQEGKLLNREVLSSGTVEGVEVAILLAAMMENSSCFYYCDERFSFIQSDIEKRIFGLMLEHLPENSQLVFTTHNTDMLDLNLPKHSFIFLRKRKMDGLFKVSAISASDMLKRNTDSLRNAVENDVFLSLPDDSLLDKLEKEWP